MIATGLHGFWYRKSMLEPALASEKNKIEYSGKDIFLTDLLMEECDDHNLLY